MKRYLPAAVLLFLAVFRTQAQQLSIAFDFSNARQTLLCLQTSKPARSSINLLLQLASTRGLMEKMNADSTVISNAILRTTDTAKQDSRLANMQYRFIKRERKKLLKFLDQLEKKQDSIRALLTRSFAGFLPDGRRANIKITVLLGGYSSGFTLGDDSIFYLGLHQYKYDLGSVIETCRHELFHNLQRLWRNAYQVTEAIVARSDTGLALVHYMLVNLFQEGSAEYIADLRKVQQPGASVKDLLAHARVNEGRESQVFYLISKLLVDAAEHPADADQNELYALLFDWNWNNPAYYAGYVMTKSLCQEYGENVLLRYLKEDPSHFVSDYIRLVRESKKETSARFTEGFVQLVERLKRVVDSLPAS